MGAPDFDGAQDDTVQRLRQTYDASTKAVVLHGKQMVDRLKGTKPAALETPQGMRLQTLVVEGEKGLAYLEAAERGQLDSRALAALERTLQRVAVSGGALFTVARKRCRTLERSVSWAEGMKGGPGGAGTGGIGSGVPESPSPAKRLRLQAADSARSKNSAAKGNSPFFSVDADDDRDDASDFGSNAVDATTPGAGIIPETPSSQANHPGHSRRNNSFTVAPRGGMPCNVPTPRAHFSAAGDGGDAASQSDDADDDGEMLASLRAAGVDVPPEFICPLSQEIMEDPVLLSGDGRVYERASAAEWLTNSTFSPSTGLPLGACSFLASHHALRRQIAAFVSDHAAVLGAAAVSNIGAGGGASGKGGKGRESGKADRFEGTAGAQERQKWDEWEEADDVTKVHD